MAGSSDIKAGGAFVELSTKDSKFHSGLKAAESRFKSFGTSVMAVGGVIAGAGLAMGGTLYHLAHKAAEAGTELLLMSERTGIGVENLSKLKYAAGQGGVEMSDLETSLKKMQKTIADDDSSKLFNELGLSIDKLRRMQPDEQFISIAEALSHVHNHTKLTADALKIFGKNGTTVLPLIKEGAEGIAEAMERAGHLGLGMTEEDAENAHKMHQQMKTLDAITAKAAQTIGSVFLPALIKVNDMDIASHGNWLKILQDHKGFILAAGVAAAATIALGVAVAGTGAIVWTFGKTIAYVTALLNAVKVVAPIAAKAFAAIGAFIIANPLLAGVTAIAGYFLYMKLTSEGVGDSIKKTFTAIKDEVVSAFKSIGDALASGDLGAAAEIGLKLVEVEWIRTCGAISGVWSETMRDMQIGFAGTSAWIASKMIDLGSTIEGLLRKNADNFDDTWTLMKVTYNDTMAALGVMTKEEADKANQVLFDQFEATKAARAKKESKLEDDRKQNITGVMEQFYDQKDKLGAAHDEKIAGIQKEIEDAKEKLALTQVDAYLGALQGDGGKHGPGGGAAPDADFASNNMKAMGTFNKGLIGQLFGPGGGADNIQKQQLAKQEEQFKFNKAQTAILWKWLDNIERNTAKAKALGITLQP
jgi:hypothetical protein